MIEKSVELLLHGTQFKQFFASQMASLRERYGLRKIDIEILYYLNHCGPYNTSRDIGETHLFTKGHISQSVERLQQMHLLTGIPDQEDRRCVHFMLTREADEIVSTIGCMREHMSSVLFEGITEEEKCVLERVAVKIMHNMERGSVYEL